MQVYSDFLNYKSGVYDSHGGSFLGYHATMTLGWGNEINKDYWLCQNSWGTKWGMYGFFKIKMGNCLIDTYGFACSPS